MTQAPQPFGIYVHWPFCLSKCPYCDFNSHVAEGIDQAAWRAGLLAELDHFAAETPERTVTSVFFGGGTPSLMDPGTVGAVLERIATHWWVDDAVEVTLEANPGTVDAGRFKDFAAAGVNRLSMGLQALDDRDLQFLGRRHDVAQALTAVGLARDVFPRISFDLIYARPGQTVAAWRAELARALLYAADHLSLYQLTIEQGTAFFPAHARGEFALPDEDTAVALFEATQEITEAAGLPAYEVSNHARPGAECRHNLLYWQGGDYVGVGPGAHGRLTMGGATAAVRQHRAPEIWQQRVAESGHGTQERTQLSAEERIHELLLMGLRLTEGVEAERFHAQTGQDLLDAVDPTGLARLVEGGFLEADAHGLRATAKGRLILNSLIADLLP